MCGLDGPGAGSHRLGSPTALPIRSQAMPPRTEVTCLSSMRCLERCPAIFLPFDSSQNRPKAPPTTTRAMAMLAGDGSDGEQTELECTALCLQCDVDWASHVNDPLHLTQWVPIGMCIPLAASGASFDRHRPGAGGGGGIPRRHKHACRAGGHASSRTKYQSTPHNFRVFHICLWRESGSFCPTTHMSMLLDRGALAGWCRCWDRLRLADCPSGSS